MHRIETVGNRRREFGDRAGRQEIGSNQEGAALGLCLEQKIRQIVARRAPDMDEHVRAAIEKQPGHFQPDAAAGTGNHHVAALEKFWVKHDILLGRLDCPSAAHPAI